MIPYLNTYGFRETEFLQPVNYNVTISSNDHIITIEDGGALLACLGLDLSDHILSLVGKDDEKFASVELPNAVGIESVEYDKEKHVIKFIVGTTSGEKEEFTIDISDLIDIYEGGNGIEITKDEDNNNKVISIKINDDNKDVLSADENGLAIDLSEYVKNSDISDLSEKLNAEILRSTEKDNAHEYSIAWLKNNKANKSDIPTLLSQLENDVPFATKTDLDDEINTINENIDSVAKRLDKAIENETNRAIVAEKKLEDEIKGLDFSTYAKQEDLNQTNANLDTLQTNVANNIATLVQAVQNLQAVDSALDEKKVDKIDGKQLSTEDYSTEEKEKLANIENYVDDTINVEITARQEVEGQIWDAINAEQVARQDVDNQQWNAINNESSERQNADKTQLDLISNEQVVREAEDANLRGQISDLSDVLNEKVNQIDFDTKVAEIENKIPSLDGYATELWVESKGYLTQHQSLENYYTKKQTDDYFFSETEWGTESEKLNTKIETCATKDELVPLLSKSEALQIYATKSELAAGLAPKVSAEQAEEIANDTVKIALTPYAKTDDIEAFVTPIADSAKTDAINASNLYTDGKITEVKNETKSEIINALAPIESEISQNANELHVLSVCNDGNEYDSAKAMTNSGTGVVDETYRLIHKLLSGIDENDLSKLNTALKNLIQ